MQTISIFLCSFKATFLPSSFLILCPSIRPQDINIINKQKDDDGHEDAVNVIATFLFSPYKLALCKDPINL